ncbi:MAG: hypothetical protein A3I89_01190 [Candidatus Harrisonbacteria bacterium RIFCSPLOWO2_02_FULL_41_11]|uniref:Glycosyl transferase family 1 domain-containing protein n=1 Tax=Candidatus Harrisonbacteria bacterium RIFCSPHIGHO2_02_FULL_42_16 TaxID=1798404 RepID=A0A1G1ZKB6_9BACT|nr:MAG: hypothetical protein A3B92_00680 [Candidatus Harrisonbacteria bacterium RIFCSPHIGHO2_02_FULL_42_16]OGY67586.1 MAG: hypothetical protein A3I89_01190 [Candidatus Harrisonbacteria bacterium RIFCSPLOWO2_02_FULL_41_11]
MSIIMKNYTNETAWGQNINILIIGTDDGIFKSNSAVRKRIVDYAAHFKSFYVISKTRDKVLSEDFESKAFFYPAYSSSFFSFIRSSYLLGSAILGKEGNWVISVENPFETALVGWLLSRRYKFPLQIQVHTDIFSNYFWKESLKNKVRVLLAKFLLPRADGVRVVSERIKQSLITQLPNYQLLPLRGISQRETIIVLPIFVDVKKIQSAPIKTDLHQKYPDYDFIILMASRLTREKNIGIAIEAMKEILKRKNLNPKPSTLNPLLLIVGDGPEGQKLESRIQNLELSTNIKIENWTDDLISYYKTADLFLLTSNYEGYGRTVVEAMSAGLPVVMTDVGIAGELLIDDLDGRVVPVGSEKALAAAIMELKENFAKKEEFKQNNLKLLEKWPTKQEYLEKYKRSLEL